MRGRPNLYTDYRKETAILNTTTQKVWALIGLSLFIASSFFYTQYWMYLITTALLTAVAAWGLNIVSGFAGQISLAHGVFVGIGTYVSAVLGGVGSSYIRGYELDMLIWLPLAGLVPALVGLLIAPLAVRLKGLNLGLVTLGLVYIGSYLFSNWKSVTGGAGLGRKTAKLKIFGIDFNDGFFLGSIHIEKDHFIFFLSLIVFLFAGVGVKNLMRSKIGRAYAAIRDRDIAAEAIGINLYRFKASAFALSSFYAGVAGSLIFVMSGGVDPSQFNLVYSVTFIAVVIIGGAGTVLGPLFGAAFFSLIPGVIKYFLHFFEGFGEQLPFHPSQLERLVFALLLIGFLIFEPRGLWGVWFRLRNYFKAWPFSY